VSSEVEHRAPLQRVEEVRLGRLVTAHERDLEARVAEPLGGGGAAQPGGGQVVRGVRDDQRRATARLGVRPAHADHLRHARADRDLKVLQPARRPPRNEIQHIVRNQREAPHSGRQELPDLPDRALVELGQDPRKCLLGLGWIRVKQGADPAVGAVPGKAYEPLVPAPVEVDRTAGRPAAVTGGDHGNERARGRRRDCRQRLVGLEDVGQLADRRALHAIGGERRPNAPVLL
jgi:hypothetical protein